MNGDVDKLQTIARKVVSLMQPPPDLTAAEWADRYMVLPPEAAQRGRMTNRLVPWAYVIGRLLNNARYKKVVLVQGAQTSKTQQIMNYVLYRMDTDPVSMLYLMPTQNTLERFSNRRLGPTLREIKHLSEVTAKGQADKVTEKNINGMPLSLGWTGSGSQLRSTPAGVVVIDEIDVMKVIKGEGDVLSLASKRTATYPNALIIVTSTPTEGRAEVETNPDTGIEHWAVSDTVASRVWQLWQSGTRLEWAVPDLGGCGRYFVPRRRHFFIDEQWTPREARVNAALVCPHCGHQLKRGQVHSLNAEGRFLGPGQWVDDEGVVQGDVIDSDTASVWVSGLMSPFPGADWGRIAEEYQAAFLAGDEAVLRVIVNTDFGEPYTPKVEAVDWESLLARRCDYALGELPAGVQVVTAACDVGGDYIMYEVRGWGYGLESYLIDWGTIDGDTSLPGAFYNLVPLLERTFGGLRVEMMAIDAGFKPGMGTKLDVSHPVYEFAREYRHQVVAVRGRDVLDNGLVYKASRVDINYRGDLKRRGLKIFHLNSDVLKSMLFSRMAWPEGVTGGFFLPRDVPGEYLRQVTAETRRVLPNGRPHWEKLRPNHALDCAYMNYFLANRLNLWERYPVDGALPGATAPRLLQPGEGELVEIPEYAPQARRGGKKKRLGGPVRRGGGVSFGVG